MAYGIDSLVNTQTEIKDGKWAISRPLLPPLRWRISDAWGVITGKYDAVWFYDPKKISKTSLQQLGRYGSFIEDEKQTI